MNDNSCRNLFPEFFYSKMLAGLKRSIAKKTLASSTSTYSIPKPVLLNPFASDPCIQGIIDQTLPEEFSSRVKEDLTQFGDRIVDELDDISRRCEIEKPTLLQFDPWGNRKDELFLSSSWNKMKEVCAQEGIVSVAYEQKSKEWSRIHQMVKLVMYSPSSGLYGCPMAMTDGAAKILQHSNLQNDFTKEAYTNLISRQPSSMWTSGQWMTEKRGGSDVASSTETIATPAKDDSNGPLELYNLSGNKFFSSATDADVAFTLAREVDSEGNPIDGNSGLSLFLLKTKLPNGDSNGINIVRLKDKYGTRQLPTAELQLTDTQAWKMSELGQGIKEIANMLQITRMHCITASVGALRRMHHLTLSYAEQRKAFGHHLIDLPLHVNQLYTIELLSKAGFVFLTKISHLLGRQECGMGSNNEKDLLRILLPLGKAFICKEAMGALSEGMECFGGQGYMEDSGIPVLIRDSQVQTIWEGTTNVQSLDVLRCIQKSSGQVLQAFMEDLDTMFSTSGSSVLSVQYKNVMNNARTLIEYVVKSDSATLPLCARHLTFDLASTYISALLLCQANKTKLPSDILAAKTWCLMYPGQNLIILSDNHYFTGWTDRQQSLTSQCDSTEES